MKPSQTLLRTSSQRNSPPPSPPPDLIPLTQTSRSNLSKIILRHPTLPMTPQPPLRFPPILILTERVFIDDTPIQPFEHGRTDEWFEEEPSAQVDPSDLGGSVGEAEVDALALGEEGG